MNINCPHYEYLQLNALLHFYVKPFNFFQNDYCKAGTAFCSEKHSYSTPKYFIYCMKFWFSGFHNKNMTLTIKIVIQTLITVNLNI